MELTEEEKDRLYWAMSDAWATHTFELNKLQKEMSLSSTELKAVEDENDEMYALVLKLRKEIGIKV